MKTTHNNLKKAFTVVELLVALAISAILLATLAVAFNASVINYQQNEQLFRLTNNARHALYKMTTQLRNAVDVSNNTPANECAFVSSDNPPRYYTYKYDSNDKKLYLVTNDILTDRDYVLCENVSAMTFDKDYDDTNLCMKSVLISMTVEYKTAHKTLSAAAVVRKNLRNPP